MAAVGGVRVSAWAEVPVEKRSGAGGAAACPQEAGGPEAGAARGWAGLAGPGGGPGDAPGGRPGEGRGGGVFLERV